MADFTLTSRTTELRLAQACNFAGEPESEFELSDLAKELEVDYRGLGISFGTLRRAQLVRRTNPMRMNRAKFVVTEAGFEYAEKKGLVV